MECKVTARKSHYPKEVPFEVPEGWAWCKIGDIADVARGGSPRPIDRYLTDDSSGINWIKIGDAEQGGKYINSTKQRIKQEGINRSRYVHSGDFLLTNSMSFGRPYILNVDGCIHDGWLVISPINDVLNKDYFYDLLSSIYAYQQFSEQASGAVVSNLNKDKVADALIPLPSISEQKRIADAVEKWITVVDLIDKDEGKLNELINEAKRKVLNLAINGKLVPQNPTEEPAIKLLRRINPSFKPSHNLHYKGDIPKGWTICTLADVSDYGKCVSVPVSEIGDEAWVLELEDIEKDTGRVLQRMKKKTRSLNGVRHRFHKSQVLYSKLRTYLNKVFVADDNGFCTTEIIPITTSDCILPKFLNLILRSPYFLDYTASCGYGVKMPRLGTNDARKALIPLPPVSEQARIIKAVNEWLQSLDKVRDLLEYGK